ncbi:MAG TPA: site-specific integrase [Deinococcales bacterium]|nr:site-specific integrase [Deinococcales bacterium]
MWETPSGNWRWQLTIPAGRGQKPRRLGGTCTTKTAAVKALAHARADLDRGLLAAPDAVTVSEYAARWLGLQRNLRESTRQNYAAELGYALATIGGTRLQAVRLPHLKEAVQAVSVRPMLGGAARGEPASPRTVRQVVARLKALFKEAVRDGLIYANPAEGLKANAPATDPKARALTPEEAVTFCRVGQALEAAGIAGLWPALYACLTVGLRRGEVLGLRWEDLDLQAGVIHVRQNVTTSKVRGGGVKIGPPKTKTSRRDVHLPPSLRDALLRHRARQAAFEEGHGLAWEPRGLIFRTSTGQPHHPDNLNRALAWVLAWCQPGGAPESRWKGVPVQARERLLAALPPVGAGVSGLRVHDLRHTYATHALRGGVPFDVVSRLLGHAKISITLDVYRHVLPDEMERGRVDLFALPEERAARVEASA